MNAPASKFKKRKLLIVDDDQQIRESLRKVLQTEGYAVAMAADGHGCLKKAENENFDVVLLDLNMPDKSGWDVFERLTSFNPFMPIIIITGRENQTYLAAAAGVGALIEKPIDVPLLLLTITELLNEDAETRLKRLAGQQNSLKFVPSVPPKSAKALPCRKHNYL